MSDEGDLRNAVQGYSRSRGSGVLWFSGSVGAVPRRVSRSGGWEGGSWWSRLVIPVCLSPEAAVL